MKPAAVLALLVLSAFAQSDNEHGVSVGPTQIAYFVKPVEVSLPVAPPNQQDFADYARRAMALQQEALTNAGGAPVAFTLSGRQTILAPKTPVPRVAFEAWSERLSRNYQEGVLTGFSGFEWESSSYRLTFRADPDSTAPQFPVPQIAQDGDTLALDLYMDAKTGQKLVDYIHVLYQSPLHTRKEPARDSYSDDAEFAISQPQLRSNGIALDPSPIPEALHGQLLAGEVSGNSLTFASAGNLFRVDCPDRIASAGPRAPPHWGSGMVIGPMVVLPSGLVTNRVDVFGGSSTVYPDGTWNSEASGSARTMLVSL
jgi:hypothetical protein